MPNPSPWFLLLIVVVLVAVFAAGIAVTCALAANRALARAEVAMTNARIARREARDWALQAQGHASRAWQARNAALIISRGASAPVAPAWPQAEAVDEPDPPGEAQDELADSRALCPLDGEPLAASFAVTATPSGTVYRHLDGLTHGDLSGGMTDRQIEPPQAFPAQEEVLLQPGQADATMAGRLVAGLHGIAGQLPEPPATEGAHAAVENPTPLTPGAIAAGLGQLGWRPEVVPTSLHAGGVIVVPNDVLTPEQRATNLQTLTLPGIGQVAVLAQAEAADKPIVVRRLPAEKAGV